MELAATTPRRSTRIPHMHTPKMSERKKGLFQGQAETPRGSLTMHRVLPVVDSESDSDEFDLGIISTLDSSSGDEHEHSTPKTPERTLWHDTRSQSRKLLIESTGLKNFIKSPFTLTKYQTRYSCPESRGTVSTPATPRLQNHPGTPSSSHSCASVHTTSSTSSKARKSLASLIADTESCSSSLKDLNFDTDSATDSKENTPTKSIRRSKRNKMTPKFHSFKGILIEQKKNTSPMKTALVCLHKMDMTSIMSPTQMLKTPHNTTEAVASPPKLGHNRRSIVEIQESPESTCDSEKSHKRLRNESMSEHAPNSKYPRLENAPKARLSLFNSDRLKEILSAKSFYGKSNPDLNTTVSTKISNAIEVSNNHHRRSLGHSHSSRRKRKPGQINLGVKHRIRKPKHNKQKMMNVKYASKSAETSYLNNSTISTVSFTDTSMKSQNSSQDLTLHNDTDKADPFDKEKQTIDALLSQWTEEEIPETELSYPKKEELPCFNKSIIEETKQIFQPITAVPVNAEIYRDSEAVIVELGMNKPIHSSPSTSVTSFVVDMPLQSAEGSQDVVMVEDGHMINHGEMPKSGQFLPVEGGYILVAENSVPAQEELPDLDEIERELKMLDEQILQLAQSNNMDAGAVLASTETDIPVTEAVTPKSEKSQKVFSIFNKPNSGIVTPTSKGGEKASRKALLKSCSDQYTIDAGQKKFGATQCTECGTIYQIGDPQDEHDHLVHHNATDVLRFNGWKEEVVVGTWDSARCVRVRGGGAHWKKVDTLLQRVVHPQLGYNADLPRADLHAYTAYLYIEKKQIVGCVVAEPKTRANKLLPGDPDCCSLEDYPVKCGITRLWTHVNYRRRHVASRLLDCVRASCLYGDAIRTCDLAFSAPTSNGKAFATKYCGTPNFYVYLD